MKIYPLKSIPLAVLTIAIASSAQAAGLTNLSEGFDNVSGLPPAWAFVNNSSPPPLIPPATWTQGDTNISNFAGQSGGINSFTQVGITSTSADTGGTVNNWLITPELDFSGGGTLSFFARTFLGNTRAEYIEVRQSTAGDSTDVGTSATSVGDFTSLIGTVGSLDAEISPGGSFPGALPSNNAWALFTFTISPTAGSGRLAFRYFATDGGVNGTQAQYAALDSVNYTAVPEPTSIAGLLMIGGVATAYRLRKKVVKA
ncbi:MAG: choice-of-anchor J domain-containing protein [Anaerolineae bacterium]|nr:choice-of-anchor J domain-containing protein [Gloeobacterales cyanobacterium ES-bin-313]